MKIILDLQDLQSLSVEGNQSDYVLSFIDDLIQVAGNETIWILLNDLFPESAIKIRNYFNNKIPCDHIVVAALATATGKLDQTPSFAEELAQIVLDYHLSQINPDVYHAFVRFSKAQHKPYMPSNCLTVLLGLIENEAVVQNGLLRADLVFPLSPSLKDQAGAAYSIYQQHVQTVNIPLVDERLSLGRPSLAFVSPLPPEKSGIADYSAELLPYLSKHYDITLITNHAEDLSEDLALLYVTKPVDWFEKFGQTFNRILYHFGNSIFHAHMFELLARHPGVVVLHDFYLGGVVGYIEATGALPHFMSQLLYHAHGYQALVDKHKSFVDALWAYPANYFVFQNARGVLLHSDYSKMLAAEWYAEAISPPIKRVPFLKKIKKEISKAQARRKLNLSQDAFVVCSFGGLVPTKLNDRLYEAWLKSDLVKSKACHLVYVGEGGDGDDFKLLKKHVKDSTAPSPIHITGFVDAETYQLYLAAADVAVQLRTKSRGETSAAVFDCLAAGLPLILNQHASNAEIPESVALMLPDIFALEQLSGALNKIYADPQFRKRLSDASHDYVVENHDPSLVAGYYYQALEDCYADQEASNYRAALRALAHKTLLHQAASDQINVAAQCLVENNDQKKQKQLLLDISEMANFDLRTGIERVGRGILLALLKSPPKGYRVEPIRRTDDGFVYARKFTCGLLSLNSNGIKDAAVVVAKGDKYLSLEWSPRNVRAMKDVLHSYRARGVDLSFIVFDLLPVLMPSHFPEKISPDYKEWLSSVYAISNRLICISKTVADQCKAFACAEGWPNASYVTSFHLGSDFENTNPTRGLSQAERKAIRAIGESTSFLMVGTVEPRKGHALILDAFEKLWRQGVDAKLVIIGKCGWNVEALAGRIKNSSEFGRKLFWFKAVSDEALADAYKAAKAIIMASEGEGFGLPLIEAAKKGVPIIARDIPVFREVAGEHASYFKGMDSEDVSERLKLWINDFERGRVVASSGIKYLTWEESAQQLLHALMDANPESSLKGH